MSTEKKPWYEDIKERFHKLELNVSYMRGELDEMKRHNWKVIKALALIIVALIGVIGGIIVAIIEGGLL